MPKQAKTLSTLLAFLGLLALASAQGQCRTPEGQRGACISIYQCQSLLQMLQTQREGAAQYLRASQCGFDDNGPQVCCPAVHNGGGAGSGEKEPPPPQPGDNPYGPLRPPHCGYSNVSHTKVVGGHAAELGAWPWISVLGYRSAKNPDQTRWLCGGSLISSRHVLTAGHCVHGRNDLFKVRIADLDLKSDFDGAEPIEIAIKRKVVHPKYSSTNYVNDIAVITLEQDVPFTYLRHPICLPVEDGIRNKIIERQYPFIAGWGAVDYKGPSSSLLQELQVPVVETETCKKAFARFNNAVIDDRIICAGYARGGKDACQGDSGGPLILPCGYNHYCQIGVVSYGYRCAEPGYPGIYTRVTAFLDFILSEMRD